MLEDPFDKINEKIKEIVKETQVDAHAFELPMAPQKAIDTILGDNLDSNHKNVLEELEESAENSIGMKNKTNIPSLLR